MNKENLEQGLTKLLKTFFTKKYDRDFLVAKISMMRIKGKSTQTILEFLMEKIKVNITFYKADNTKYQNKQTNPKY